MDQPRVLSSLWGIVRVLITVDRPIYGGSEAIDHSEFGTILRAVATSGGSDLRDHSHSLRSYANRLGAFDPEQLTRDEALAYWINLYNAGALLLAAEAQSKGEISVLRIPGAFGRTFATINGETLSLDAIEHAKIRRFGDPRIHAALVCGSVSCPTLRSEPYDGQNLEAELEDQMKSFLTNGAGNLKSDGTLELSRVFLWYGSDFVRPERMPTFIPSSKEKILEALTEWLPVPVSKVEAIAFQDYDWGLRCSVG